MRRERRQALLTETWMQILFGVGLVLAALGGLALMRRVSCSARCEAQVTGVMFSRFTTVIPLISGGRRGRAQIPALTN